MTVFTEHIDIPVAGGDLHVGAAGDPDAPVVVAVHGITGNHHAWAAVVRRVRDHMRVLAPDLRGRGGSVGLPGPFGMAAHAALWAPASPNPPVGQDQQLALLLEC